MSDHSSPRLGLPYLAAGQLQKHVTLNESLARLDSLVQTQVRAAAGLRRREMRPRATSTS